jgi:TonB family protein
MPHVLLVDDDEAFAAGLAQAVAAESFTTTVVGTLAAARAEIRRSAPDVLLLDIHLPDGNGLDLFKELQATSAEVVLMTGRASVETAVEALRYGAADYLVKPVDLARLKRVLANTSRTRDLRALIGHLPWATARPARSAPAGIETFGRYVVEGELGDGAMGRVYRGQDPLLRRPVAIKTVKSEYLTRDTREEYLRRFRREAQAAGMLSHPNIVGIFDVGEDFIVMEYVEGVTLQALLKHRGSLDLASALRILTPLAEALDYAHGSGVIHRDLKPGNIMVQPDGRPKLMDFGVARLETSAVTDTGRFFGSPSYTSPEQILGTELTQRADLFSFAVVAYETLTGRRPFQGESVTAIIYRVVHDDPPPPRSVNEQLPPVYDAAFARALNKDPAGRFPSAIAFVSALVGDEGQAQFAELSAQPLLEALLSVPSAPAETQALPDVQAAVRGAKSRNLWRGLAAAVAVVAVAGLAVSFRGRAAAPVAEPGVRAVGPLRIETEPVGVPVWLDGRLVGRSPLSVPLLPGAHQVRLAKDGYAPAAVALEVAGGTTPAPLRFLLSPLAAPAPRASASPPARVEEPRVTLAPLAGAEPSAEMVGAAPDVTPPRRISGKPAPYPDSARRLKLAGTVSVEMTITEKGQVAGVTVLESAGATLDEAVIDSLYRSQFEPARKGARRSPVAVRWRYRQSFRPPK